MLKRIYCNLLVFSLVAIHLSDADSSLVDHRRRCIPTATVRGPCHVCICSAEGEFHCRTEPCKNTTPNITTTRGRVNKQDLPEIKEGDDCVPHKLYKMSCNTCRCGENKALFCTKMACLNGEDMAKLMKKHTKTVDKETFLRDREIERKRTIIIGRDAPYPKLPKNKKCKPGQIYNDGCRKCFCNDDQQVVYGLEKCFKTPRGLVLVPEHVRPPFTQKEIERLPKLPNIAAQCKPGKTYAVNCNGCLCLADGNLLCDRALCLSFEDVNRIQAKKHSGIKCDKGSWQKKIGDMKNLCIKCSCVKNTLKCKNIKGCVTTKQKEIQEKMKLHKPRLTLDHKREKCQSEMIYTDKCNKCYCQPDSTLRCTRKTCLKRTQQIKLKKQHLRLVKYGL